MRETYGGSRAGDWLTGDQPFRQVPRGERWALKGQWGRATMERGAGPQSFVPRTGLAVYVACTYRSIPTTITHELYRRGHVPRRCRSGTAEVPLRRNCSDTSSVSFGCRLRVSRATWYRCGVAPKRSWSRAENARSSIPFGIRGSVAVFGIWPRFSRSTPTASQRDVPKLLSAARWAQAPRGSASATILLALARRSRAAWPTRSHAGDDRSPRLGRQCSGLALCSACGPTRVSLLC